MLCLNRLPSVGQRLAVAAEHQAAGGLPVQPMGERGPPRQAEAQRVEMILQGTAALRAAMHGQAGRLVDDQHQPVAVEHPRHHLFRCHARTGITAIGMNDSTEQKTGGWWAAAHRRPQADLGLDRQRDRRSGVQAQARRRDAGGDRGRADPRRSRRRRRRAGLRGAGQGPLRQGDRSPRRSSGCWPPRWRRSWRRSPSRWPWTAPSPSSILVVGVNGSGKTTTIGKLAARFAAEGRKVLLAAGDTFRAAAIEQLKIWGSRTGATVVARETGRRRRGACLRCADQRRKAKAPTCC